MRCQSGDQSTDQSTLLPHSVKGSAIVAIRIPVRQPIGVSRGALLEYVCLSARLRTLPICRLRAASNPRYQEGPPDGPWQSQHLLRQSQSCHFGFGVKHVGHELPHLLPNERCSSTHGFDFYITGEVRPSGVFTASMYIEPKEGYGIRGTAEDTVARANRSRLAMSIILGPWMTGF